ncbi:hypothetical protein JCM10207_000136 [Rhodosporidiobolus poonsookiae]
MLRTASRQLSTTLQRYSTAHAPSPHPALTLIPDFLSPTDQSLLLNHSLHLLDAPARTTAAGRRKRRDWLRAHPDWTPGANPFMADDAYAWEEAHFDAVIKRYREMLVPEGAWGDDDDHGELRTVLDKVYSLLPPSPSSSSTASDASPVPPRAASSPPSHLIMHLLHLSSSGAIYPHVDNLEAFGRQIVGVSLGSERVMRFKRVSEPGEGMEKGGPHEFEVLVEPGSAYIQREPLRTHYTHEVLEKANWEGRQVGGSQRLSIMLRDRLPSDAGSLQA